MYIVIVGAGNLGYYLAQLLLEEENDVTVVEKDEARCATVSESLGITVNHGDGTDPKVLEKVSVKEADAVVALTNADETNMVICLLAKELGAKNVAARLGRIEYDEAVLKKLGIDIVIHPEAAAAGYIAELITKPEILDLAFISRGEAEIIEVKIKEGSKIAGKKVKEIEHPAGSAIIAIYQKDQLVIPDSEAVVEAGSKILILTKREIADKVRKLIS